MNSLTKSRYLNIDALRGIAAFLVVLHHLFGSGAVFKNYLLPEKLSFFNVIYFIPGYGYVGVYLFFVISGFCIHLRWAKSYRKGNESPEIKFIPFWKRRWLRLYPGYLAALFLFLSFHYSVGQLKFDGLFIWDMISHLLMIHNFDYRTVYSMDGVFWTLAIEEQLYLIYFLLIWMRKRFDWKTTLAVCFAARFIWFGFVLILYKFFSVEIPFSEGALANWWIWALGAVAVENYLGIIKFPRWCYSLSLSFFFLFLGGAIHYFGSSPVYYLDKIMWLGEPFFWGVGFFFLINRVMQYENMLKSVFIKKVVGIWGAIGLISYSLYITHQVILDVFSGLSPVLLIGVCLLFSYAFFLIFEKPFMIYLSKQKS